METVENRGNTKITKTMMFVKCHDFAKNL